MKNGMRRIAAVFVAFAMTLSLCPWVLAAYPAETRTGVDGDYTGKTVILHSNDVHGEIMGYAYMAALRKQFQERGADVILADAGDFSQGDPAVSFSKGLTAVAMMNATGYDVATLGNHEFDYGYENLMGNLESAEFSVICADVYEGDTNILSPTWEYEDVQSGLRIGFFGMETPETQTKVNPGLIQDIRFVSNTGTDKTALYDCAQEWINILRGNGADIVIALTHLGVDAESAPDGHRSVDLYNHTSGIDLILDGHSHTVMTAGENGEPIQSTGTKFQHVGVVVIDEASKTIEDHYLIPTEGLELDPDVAAAAQDILDQIDEQYGAVFAVSHVLLNGERNPGNRTQETNLGDLITDAMVWKVLEDNRDSDGNASLSAGSITVDEAHVVGITNGGGIRASIEAGDVTMRDLNTVLPFGNTVAVVFVSGAELLEALEASTFSTPQELGAYPQTRGIRFTLDTSKPYAQGSAYPDSTYYAPASIQRLTITSVNGCPFDPDAIYAVVTNDFCAAGGDTYYVFKNARAQFDTGIPMDEAVMEYISEELYNSIDADQYGQTRHDQVQLTGLSGTDSLAAAFADIPADSVGGVALSGDMILTETARVTEGQDITLDLAGHILTVSSGGFAVDGGSLTITDSAEDGTIIASGLADALIVQTDGAVTIDDGTVNVTGGSIVRSVGPAAPAEEGTHAERSQLTVGGEAALNAGFQSDTSNTAIYVEGLVDFTMEQGSLTAMNGTAVILRSNDDGQPAFTMSDGVMEASGESGSPTAISAMGASVSIQGVVSARGGPSATAVYFQAGDTSDTSIFNRPYLSVSDGASLTADAAGNAWGIRFAGGNGFVSDAAITATSEASATAVQVEAGMLMIYQRDGETAISARGGSGASDALRVTAGTDESTLGYISDGRITGSVYAERDGVRVLDNALLSLVGGVYSVRPDAAYLGQHTDEDGQVHDIVRIAEAQAEDGTTVYQVEELGNLRTVDWRYTYDNTHGAYTGMNGVESAVVGTRVTIRVEDAADAVTGQWTVEDGESLQIVAGSLTGPSVTFLMPDRDVNLTGEFREGTSEMEGKTVILHSNDVHGEIMGYAYMAALRDRFQYQGANVLLADAGDFSQGSPYVSLSKGANAIDMMNAVGYDVATLGNHEFDFGYEQLRDNIFRASFPFICADVYENEEPILSPTYTTTVGDGDDSVTIGFFGMETPETQTKVNPGLIQDIRFVSNTTQAGSLYACAQEQIDALRNDGADIVIGLTHLGVDSESAPDGHRSVDLYNNTHGVDLLLDGHSHTVMTGWANDAPYNPFETTAAPADTLLPIQSTGTKFAYIGVVVIDNASKAIEDHYLLPTADMEMDEEVAAAAQDILDRVDDEYGQVFASSQVLLNGERDPGNRTEETNLGDLITDAMVWTVLEENRNEDGTAVLSVDGVSVDESHVVGITNGGGIRASIEAGDVTMRDLNTVLPFGNTVAVVFVTGAELLETLEASTYAAPEAMGGYPQTCGITFTLDTTKPYAQGTAYPDSTYYAPASIQRVTISAVNGEPFDPSSVYAVVTNNFCAAGGDTYYAFKAARAQFDTGIIMDEAVMEYVASYLNGVITTAAYGQPRGDQTILTGQNPDDTPDEPSAGGLYELTVVGGSGSGQYTQGVTVSVSARIPEGKVFDRWTWTGPDALVFGPGGQSLASTTFTMPGANVNLTATFRDASTNAPTPQGCYVATAVYGSYDCPEVWTLRRYRDQVLGRTWYGRLFIHLYYAVSPTAVRLFGKTTLFQNFFRGILDPWVADLQADGFASTPYEDRAW